MHPSDILRARTDELWCKRYMAHGDLDIDKAFDYMMDSVKFRNEFGVNGEQEEGALHVEKMSKNGYLVVRPSMVFKLRVFDDC